MAKSRHESYKKNHLAILVSKCSTSDFQSMRLEVFRICACASYWDGPSVESICLCSVLSWWKIKEVNETSQNQANLGHTMHSCFALHVCSSVPGCVPSCQPSCITPRTVPAVLSVLWTWKSCGLPQPVGQSVSSQKVQRSIQKKNNENH